MAKHHSFSTTAADECWPMVSNDRQNTGSEFCTGRALPVGTAATILPHMVNLSNDPLSHELKTFPAIIKRYFSLDSQTPAPRRIDQYQNGLDRGARRVRRLVELLRILFRQITGRLKRGTSWFFVASVALSEQAWRTIKPLECLKVLPVHFYCLQFLWIG